MKLQPLSYRFVDFLAPQNYGQFAPTEQWVVCGYGATDLPPIPGWHTFEYEAEIDKHLDLDSPERSALDRLKDLRSQVLVTGAPSVYACAIAARLQLNLAEWGIESLKKLDALIVPDASVFSMQHRRPQDFNWRRAQRLEFEQQLSAAWTGIDRPQFWSDAQWIAFASSVFEKFTKHLLEQVRP